MTKPEFVAQWRDRLAGMALTGLVLDTDDKSRGPSGTGSRAIEIAGKVDQLLAQMWASAQQPEPPLPVKAEPPKQTPAPPPAVNGQQPLPARRTA